MSLILDMLGIPEPHTWIVDDPEIARDILSGLTKEELEKAKVK